MAFRTYRYVGPSHIAERVRDQPPGRPIVTPNDVMEWIRAGSYPALVVVTFTVDEALGLRIADRHSEHVACAGFAVVTAAGEMTLEVDRGQVEVIALTNQSTGYCPEPGCWAAVDAALSRIGLAHPDGFEATFDFRRCPACATINLIKDDWYVCACGAPLPKAWNLSCNAEIG